MPGKHDRAFHKHVEEEAKQEARNRIKGWLEDCHGYGDSCFDVFEEWPCTDPNQLQPIKLGRRMHVVSRADLSLIRQLIRQLV